MSLDEIMEILNTADSLLGAEREDEAFVLYKKAISLDTKKEYSAMPHFRLGIIHSFFRDEDDILCSCYFCPDQS